MPDPAPGQATGPAREQEGGTGTRHTVMMEAAPGQRPDLTLRSMQGLSYEEIGQCLGLRAGTVKSVWPEPGNRLRRALEEVREQNAVRCRLRKQKGASADAMQKKRTGC